MEKKKGGAGVAGMASKPAAIEDTQSSFNNGNTSTDFAPKNNPQQESEIQRLNMLVKQRDNEIGILLNYLNKKKE